jgi:hypothetical protein
MRWLFFAASLCVSASALADRAGISACDRSTMLFTRTWSVSSVPMDGAGSDDWWDAQHLATISLTPSGWRVPLSCTDVQREPGQQAVSSGQPTSPLTRPPPHVAAHLQHIPLLI